MKNSSITFFILLLAQHISFGQCGCLGGAAVGGLTPVGGTVNVGVLRQGFFRAAAFYSYSYGDSYLKGDAPAGQGPVNKYSTQYSGILLGYGITKKLTLEAEISGYPEKYQILDDDELYGRGFSHILISGKYNFYYDIKDEFEISAGIGGKAPLSANNENSPQHIMPSTGAFGIALQAFLHKGYKDQGLRFILIHRANYNAENSLEYQYGAGLFTSFFSAKSITNEITGIVEIRNEYRFKDKYKGDSQFDSGSNIFIISPQINYVFGDFNISALFDYPFYKYYNGYQLANKYSLALNLTWQTKLTGE